MSEGPAATVGGGTALLQNVSVGVGVVAGVLASFYSVGMLLVSLRLQQYGLPVEPVVGQLTQQSLAIVGLIEVGLPALGVAILCAILRGAALFAWRRLTRTEMAPLQFIELVGWVTAALLLTGPAPHSWTLVPSALPLPASSTHLPPIPGVIGPAVRLAPPPVA